MSISPQEMNDALFDASPIEKRFRELHRKWLEPNSTEYSEKLLNLGLDNSRRLKLDVEFEQFITTHLFVITVAFRKDTVLLWEPRYVEQALYSHPLHEYEKLDFIVRQRMLADEASQSTSCNTLTYAWVDFANSEHLEKIGLEDARDPHVCALALVHPEQAMRFVSYMTDHSILQRVPKIESATVSPYNRRLSGLSDCIGHCSRAYAQFAISRDSSVKDRSRSIFG